MIQANLFATSKLDSRNAIHAKSTHFGEQLQVIDADDDGPRSRASALCRRVLSHTDGAVLRTRVKKSQAHAINEIASAQMISAGFALRKRESDGSA